MTVPSTASATSAAPPAPAVPRRAAVVFIFFTLLFDVISIGIVIPVFPRLIESFMGGNTASAARVYGLFGTMWALMQFVFSPVLGALSDRFGRRVVILVSCFGLGLDYVFMALAPTLGWLFVGRIISGITAASFPTAMAYISDVTPPERRAASFGILGAAFGSGFILGPAIGGLLGTHSPRLPFWVAGAFSLANALYGLFVLPESLAPEHRRPFSWRRANPVGSLSLLRARPGLAEMVAVYATYMLAQIGMQSVFVLYTGHRYHWDPRAVGLTLAVVGVCSIVVQGALVRRAIARLGERRTLLFGLCGGALGYLAYAFAPSGAALRWSVPVAALMFFVGPPLQSLMSRRVAPSEHGLLQGVNSSMMGLAGIMGPALFTQIFAAFLVPHFGVTLPGAPFILCALLMVVGVGLARHATRGSAPAPYAATGAATSSTGTAPTSSAES